MADKIVKIYGDARFLPRHDTLENWQRKNPILLEAEPSYVIDGEDGKKIKFGDGVTPWNDLPYLSSNINNGGDITVDQTYNPDSENAQSGKAVAEAISEALMDYDHNFSEIKGLNVIRIQRAENGTHTSILKYISATSADERILIFDNEIVIEVSDSIEYLNSIGFEVDSTYQIKISNGELEYIGKLKKGAPMIVDQTYNPNSENAQSGKAVAEALQGANSQWEKLSDVTITEEVNTITCTHEDMPQCKEFILRAIFPVSTTGVNVSLGAAYCYLNNNNSRAFGFMATDINKSVITEQRCHILIADDLIYSIGNDAARGQASIMSSANTIIGNRVITDNVTQIIYKLNDSTKSYQIGTHFQVYGKVEK